MKIDCNRKLWISIVYLFNQRLFSLLSMWCLWFFHYTASDKQNKTPWPFIKTSVCITKCLPWSNGEIVMHVDGYLRLAGFTARNYSPSKGSTMAQHCLTVVKWIQSDLYSHFRVIRPPPHPPDTQKNTQTPHLFPHAHTFTQPSSLFSSFISHRSPHKSTAERRKCYILLAISPISSHWTALNSMLRKPFRETF